MSDDLVADVIEVMRTRPEEMRMAIQGLAEREPDRPAADLAAALLGAAEAVDHTLEKEGGPTGEALALRRMAGLLREDIAQLAEAGDPPTLAQLLRWWRSEEDVFRRL